MKKISFEEKRLIQLEMLKEIDIFCKENNIRYSLAFGTLLGAIRHKGFIPWDDDVDIMMPLPDMLCFKALFKSKTMKYCDVDTEKHYSFPFSRIAQTNTINKKGIFVYTKGICIDLYPIISLPSSEEEEKLFFDKAKPLCEHRLFYKKWNSRLASFLPIEALPGTDKVMKKYRDFILNSVPYGKTDKYYIIAGPLMLRKKMSYDLDLFKELIEVNFENYQFSAISQYHYYLTLRYGDYMQLPPESERVPKHEADYYWR